MIKLSTRQQNICSSVGTFGALLTATCLVQLIILMNEHWITFTMIAFYIFIIISFVMLSLQKTISPTLLIVSSVLALLVWFGTWFGGAFSLVVLLLLLYTVVSVIIIYVERIPATLKEKAAAAREEELAWRDKI